MTERRDLIPAEAQRAARRGAIVEAVKITRTQTGLGLAEARQAVEDWLHGAPAQATGPGTDATLSPAAIASLRRGSLIAAVRDTRERTGLGLKDAKELVEELLQRDPLLHAQFRDAARAAFRRAARGALLLLVLTALLALLLHYLGLGTTETPR